MIWCWLLALRALAADPVVEAEPAAAPVVVEADLVVPDGLRVDTTEGWTLNGHTLLAPDGAAVQIQFQNSAASAPPDQADLEAEKLALTAELAERGLVPVELTGRVLNTALGEPVLVLQARLREAKRKRKEHGAISRQVRRCGAVARLTLESETAGASEAAILSRAGARILWADPACEHFNPRAFHQMVESPALSLEEPPPPPPPPARWPYALGSLVLIGAIGAFFLHRPGAKTKSRPAPLTDILLPPTQPAIRNPPRPADAPRRGEQARASDLSRISETNYVGVMAPQIESPMPSEPARPPSAMRLAPPPAERAINEGPLIFPPKAAPAAPASPSDDDGLAAALRALGDQTGLVSGGPPVPLPEGLPAQLGRVLALHDGLDLGQGWLRLLAVGNGSLRDLNAALGPQVGPRLIVGFFGDGALLTLGLESRVEVGWPDGRPVRVLDGDLERVLRRLGEQPLFRDELCDLLAHKRYLRVLGALGPAEVIDVRGGRPKAVDLRERWGEAFFI